MTKMDDDVPATRGDLKAYATRDELEVRFATLATKADLKTELQNYPTKHDLKAELEAFATKADLKAELQNYPTKHDLKAELDPVKASIELLAQNDMRLHHEIQATRVELQAVERRLEVTLTRTISAAYESFRKDFRVLDDQDKAISERSTREIGHVLEELDAHREDPKAHRRR